MRRLAASLIASLTLAMSGAAASAPGDQMYTRPGRIVPAGDGARLNLYCTGSGSPTVVIDSGFEDWSPDWAVVQPRISQFTRACSYDRAGYGFSEPGPLPRTAARIASELHGALHAAGIAGPYILVGNAFGGDPVRAFADLYMDEVAGLVLADADASDLEPPAMRGEDDQGDLAAIPGLIDCRDAVARGGPLPPLPPAPGLPPRTCVQQLFRGLPEAEWSPELNASLMDIAKTKVALWDAVVSEMREMPGDETWLQKHSRSFGARPIRVLTSGNHGVGHLERPRPTSLKHLKYEYDVALAQARWLTMSSNARQIFTSHSSEYIGFDEPDVFVDAVREVYAQAK
jgi:pimeloyl-ACP methyl ester carboxylesterase